jgi:hypothetical protein
MPDGPFVDDMLPSDVGGFHAGLVVRDDLGIHFGAEALRAFPWRGDGRTLDSLLPRPA